MDKSKQQQELIEQLQGLINTSPLSDKSKQKAVAKTEELSDASDKPPEEQQNIAQRTLDYIDGLADTLEAVPETATKLGTVATKIAQIFALA